MNGAILCSLKGREKMAIKPGKDREKSERQKNGEKLDGAHSMMKTNFSQKRVEKNGKSAEKSIFLRRKPLLLVGQKGSNPRPSSKDPKHAVFSQKERNLGQKSPICGQAYPDLTEKQRKKGLRKRKKRAFQNFLFGFLCFLRTSQPADVVSGLEAIRGPGNPCISKLFRQVGGSEGHAATSPRVLKMNNFRSQPFLY
jgi:hypothetical protein